MASRGMQNREINQIIERQMRQWELERSAQAEKERQAHLAAGKGEVIDYIAISREPGSGGEQIGEILAGLLKWQWYDREILDRMAEDIREIIKNLVLLGAERDCLIRVILSRGPGSFSTNPYDCPSSQIYVNIIRFRKMPETYYEEGISLITSDIPVKKTFFANIKSCNYLPNVLMKKEAVAAGCPYSVALDEQGFLAEGSTENVGVLTKDGILKFPEFERILSGITVNRVFQLANELLEEGMIRGVEFARISPSEAYQAEEMFLTGTSLEIVPVVSYDGKRIGKGVPGHVYTKLSSLLWGDMTQNRELLTELDWES